MWHVMGASVAGESHLKTGRECQDSSDWLCIDDVVVLAVADGAGSRPLSAKGSSAAVQTVREHGMNLASTGIDPTPGDWISAVFVDLNKALTRTAAGDDVDVADYATTLAVAVITPKGTAIGQIGDSIAVVRRNRRHEVVAPAPRYEYANETDFLTASDFASRLRTATFEPGQIDEIYLSTDGLRMKILKLATGEPYAPFFEDLATYIRAGNATPDSIRRILETVNDQTGDDKSLAVAVFQDETPAVPAHEPLDEGHVRDPVHLTSP